MMELVWARFEKEQKEVCIISLDQLKLDDETKSLEDDEEEEKEEDNVELQAEHLEEVNELPTDKLTK